MSTDSPTTARSSSSSDYVNGTIPFGSIDSPSATDKYQVVLRDDARDLHLQHALCVIETDGVDIDGSAVRQQVLGQVRDLAMRNHHHEVPIFQAQLRHRGIIPGLSGRADHVTAAVYPVDAISLDPDGRLEGKIAAGATVPQTGTNVILADNASVSRFIAPDAPGLLNIGYLTGETNLPITLPHHGHGRDGTSEGRHLGIFAPSGAGKTVMIAQLICGWARHPQMGQLIIDHDGDLSAMKIGDRGDGSPHVDLARGLLAAGRDLQADIVVVDHRQLRLDAPKDLAKALRMHQFLRTLGVGAGEKTQACEEKLYRVIKEMCSDATPFSRLSYDDAISSICEACAETYALGKSGNGRTQKADELLASATGGGITERELRRIWQEVQGYNARPYMIADVIEQALFDGKLVFIDRADADDSGFDDMVLKRVVRTMLDIIKTAYLLGRSERDLVYGRFGYLQSRFGRYKTASVNAVCILDEAHAVASEEDAREEGSVAADIALAIKHTRKYKLAFCVATQQIAALSKSVFENLRTYMFGYGLKSGSEQQRVREILAEPSAYRLYEGLPDPKASGIYKFAIQGGALPLANGAPLFIRAYPTQDDFLAANIAHGLHDPGIQQVPLTVGAPAAELPALQGLDDFDLPA
jgi:hypothetical protein